MNGLDWKGSLKVTKCDPLNEQGHLQLHQVAKSHIHQCFKPKRPLLFCRDDAALEGAGSPSTHPTVWHFCPLCSVPAPLMAALTPSKGSNAGECSLTAQKKKIKNNRVWRSCLNINLNSLNREGKPGVCTTGPATVTVHQFHGSTAKTQPKPPHSLPAEGRPTKKSTKPWGEARGCLFPVSILNSNSRSTCHCTHVRSCCLSFCLSFPRAACEKPSLP